MCRECKDPNSHEIKIISLSTLGFQRISLSREIVTHNCYNESNYFDTCIGVIADDGWNIYPLEPIQNTIVALKS